jgi:hypothetical protein
MKINVFACAQSGLRYLWCLLERSCRACAMRTCVSLRDQQGPLDPACGMCGDKQSAAIAILDNGLNSRRLLGSHMSLIQF